VEANGRLPAKFGSSAGRFPAALPGGILVQAIQAGGTGLAEVELAEPNFFGAGFQT
jgi:hypothetical protein